MTLLDDAALDGLRQLAGPVGSGDVIDERFELHEAIGSGAMGEVFAAWDRDRATEVAVKLLRELRDSERFEREAEVLARADHPGVVAYVAHGEHSGLAYVVMERLHGCTLAERLRRGPLTVRHTLQLAQRIAEALAAMHALGVLHRDVKPSNIMLVGDRPDDARLVDFGLARHERAGALTATGALVGTPGYMAPEQVRAESNLDGRADVFALGCVLHECLAGAPAFIADDTERLLTKILLEAPDRRDNVPPALDEAVAAMLAKDVTRRPSASEVAAMLSAIEPPAADEPSSGVARVQVADVIAGKYEVVGEIGRGGMGIVVAATHRTLGTEVALKILQRQDAATRSVDEARFLREAQAAARIESEHAVRVIDVGRMRDGAPFIVMERLRGRDLARVLREDGPLAPERAVTQVLEACEALAEAHGLGIVHRDLKPSNLFATERRDGTPLTKVLDFGISKLTRPFGESSRAALSITSPTAVMGSAAYMSPEQLRASKTVDFRTDIWSLGVVLHELIAGEPPFHANSPAAIGAVIATEPPPPLDGLAPPGLGAVVHRCLQKDPSDRYPDIAALAEALAPFAPPDRADRSARIRRVLSQPPSEPTSPAISAATPTARRSWRLALGGALLLGAVTLYITTRSPNETTPAPASADSPTASPANSGAGASTANSVASPADPDPALVAPTASAPSIPGSVGPNPRPTALKPPRPSPISAPAASSPAASSPTPARPAPARPAPAPARSSDIDLLDPALQRR